MIRVLSALLLVLPFALPQARADEVGAALHDSRWADADALAAASPDPVARKLVLYFRLLTPGAAHAAEIAGFMAANPAWPNQAVLARRLSEAMAIEPDDRTVLDICARQPVREIASMLRCATADANTGHAPDAVEAARQAWTRGITDPGAELAFIRQWGKSLTAADQWARFDRLAWTDNGAVGGPAFRQIARLDALQRPTAEARLALKRDDPSARALVTALPGGATIDPALMLELAKWLRRAGQDDDAQKLWLAMGADAERAATPEHRPAFWDERNLLARRRLRVADAAGAYALVNGDCRPGPGGGDRRRVPGRVHRAAPAERHGCRRPALPRACRAQPRRHHPGARLLLARPHRRRAARPGGRQGRLPPGRRLAHHVLRPTRRPRPGRG